MIDHNGVNPTRHVELPPQMAALCASNMPMFDLGATAAIERSKEAAIQALMLDPLTRRFAAVGNPRHDAGNVRGGEGVSAEIQVGGTGLGTLDKRGLGSINGE